MAISRMIMHRRKSRAMLTIMALGVATSQFAFAADQKAQDLPPMMSSGSVITPEMLKKQLGDDYLEMNGDDMFSEPDPLGSVKSPIPESLKEADKKAADTAKPAEQKPDATADKTSPAFDNKTAPKKAPITAVKPVESAPLAPPTINDKDGGLPVAFPSETKVPEAPKLAEQPPAIPQPPALAEPVPQPPAMPAEPAAPIAEAPKTEIKKAEENKTAESTPFYKKAWNKLFSSDDKPAEKKAEKPAELAVPKPPEPTPAEVLPPLQDNAVVEQPKQPIIPEEPALPAVEKAPSAAAAIMPPETKTAPPLVMDLKVPPPDVPPEKPAVADKAVDKKPVADDKKSGKSKNLAAEPAKPQLALPTPAQKPEAEKPAELAAPEIAKPEIAKEEPKPDLLMPQIPDAPAPEPKMEAPTVAAPVVQPEMPALPVAQPEQPVAAETAKTAPESVIEPEAPALPPANPPKADYPLPSVAGETPPAAPANNEKLPFADIQAATPVEKIDAAKPVEEAKPTQTAIDAPQPAQKPEAPKDMLDKYQNKREMDALHRKYANDGLTKRYKGYDYSYVPEPNASKSIADKGEVQDLAPLTSGDSPSMPYDSGLSAPTERMLKKFPKGISSLKNKGEDKPAKHVSIERGNTASQFPKEGYSDDAPIGISVSDKGNSEDIDAMLEQAYSAVQLDQMESAIELYKRAVAKHPEHKLALFGLATSYQKDNQSKKARAVYERLLKIYPDYSEALNNFLVLVAEESPSSALSELGKLEKRNPEFSPILAQMGLIYMRQEDYRNAANYLGRAMALSPENMSYRYNMAIVMDNMGEREEAIDLYEQILKAKKSGTSLPFKPEGIEERLTFLRSNRG